MRQWSHQQYQKMKLLESSLRIRRKGVLKRSVQFHFDPSFVSASRDLAFIHFFYVWSDHIRSIDTSQHLPKNVLKRLSSYEFPHSQKHLISIYLRLLIFSLHQCKHHRVSKTFYIIFCKCYFLLHRYRFPKINIYYSSLHGIHSLLFRIILLFFSYFSLLPSLFSLFIIVFLISRNHDLINLAGDLIRSRVRHQNDFPLGVSESHHTTADQITSQISHLFIRFSVFDISHRQRDKSTYQHKMLSV